MREKALLRELIRVATRDHRAGLRGERRRAEAARRRRAAASSSISERRIQGARSPCGTSSKDTFKHIERLYERKEHITGLATGFDELDEMTSGLQPVDFIIIAGRPSMGKTAFALNIAKHAGVELHRRVLVLSLEMSKEQLVQRLLCAEARVDSRKVRTGYHASRGDWTPHRQRGGPARRGARSSSTTPPASRCSRRAPRRGA